MSQITKYLSKIGAKGGKATSEAKQEASRKNWEKAAKALKEMRAEKAANEPRKINAKRRKGE